MIQTEPRLDPLCWSWLDRESRKEKVQVSHHEALMRLRLIYCVEPQLES